MEFPATFNGIRVHVVRPYKTYSAVWYKNKNSNKRKWQKVWRFTGWKNLLVDGEVIQTSAGMFVNEATALEMQRILENAKVGAAKI